MTDTVLTETRDSVCVITLNRPDARNAVNPELAGGLADALERLDADESARVGVLTGAGSGFCAGMDLKAFVHGGFPTVADRGFAGITERSCDKPLIAAVEGFALAGGLEVALSCDLIVAGQGARLGIPEVQVGLFAAAGGLLRLPRRLPYALAMELALTGEPMTGERAGQFGLVNRVTPDGGALAEARALAERIAGNAPLGLAASKAVLQGAHGRTEDEFWQFQRPYLQPVLTSQDATEGATAFAEKRPPHWIGR